LIFVSIDFCLCGGFELMHARKERCYLAVSINGVALYLIPFYLTPRPFYSLYIIPRPFYSLGLPTLILLCLLPRQRLR
jgi:hypothetical protein